MASGKLHSSFLEKVRSQNSIFDPRQPLEHWESWSVRCGKDKDSGDIARDAYPRLSANPSALRHFAKQPAISEWLPDTLLY